MSLVEKLDQYANRAGLKWTSRTTAILVTGIPAALSFIAANGLSDPSRLGWAATTAFVVGATALFLWLLSCRPPKTPRGRAGIVIAIATEQEAERKRLKSELIEYLVGYLENRPSVVPFKVIDVPSYLAPSVSDRASALAMRDACRGTLLIWGDVRTRGSRGQDTLVIRLEGLVSHRETATSRSQALGQDMRVALPAQTEIDPSNELQGFEATSQELALASKYIVALALAVSDDWAGSKALLRELEAELIPSKPTTGKRRASSRARLSTSGLRKLLPKRLTEICFADYLHRARKWSDNRADASLLVEAEAALEDYRQASIRHDKDGPRYWIPKAMYEVTLRRNLQQAERLLRQCQAVAIADPTWRLSLAFVSTLQNDFGAALKNYDAAFQLAPSIELVLEIESYVHWWLQENQGPPALYLLSAMLNSRGKNDPDLARQDLDSFKRGFPEGIPVNLQMRFRDLTSETRDLACAASN